MSTVCSWRSLHGRWRVLLLAELNGFCGSLVETVERVDLEARLLDEPIKGEAVSGLSQDAQDVRLGFLLLRALQSDDERDAELQLLCRLDDTLSDEIATHDAYIGLARRR